MDNATDIKFQELTTLQGRLVDAERGARLISDALWDGRATDEELEAAEDYVLELSLQVKKLRAEIKKSAEESVQATAQCGTSVTPDSLAMGTDSYTEIQERKDAFLAAQVNPTTTTDMDEVVHAARLFGASQESINKVQSQGTQGAFHCRLAYLEGRALGATHSIGTPGYVSAQRRALTSRRAAMRAKLQGGRSS